MLPAAPNGGNAFHLSFPVKHPVVSRASRPFKNKGAKTGLPAFCGSFPLTPPPRE